jgi:hypothetical protein
MRLPYFIIIKALALMAVAMQVAEMAKFLNPHVNAQEVIA